MVQLKSIVDILIMTYFQNIYGYDFTLFSQESSCCGYGADGMKSDGGADCILIPGAEKAVAPVTLSMGGACQGGGAKGLVTVTNGDTKTICSKFLQYTQRDQAVSMMNKNHKYKISTIL